jgi:hypothetical protein
MLSECILKRFITKLERTEKILSSDLRHYQKKYAGKKTVFHKETPPNLILIHNFLMPEMVTNSTRIKIIYTIMRQK